MSMFHQVSNHRSALAVAIASALFSSQGYAQEAAAGERQQPQELAPLDVTAERDKRKTEGVDSYTTESMKTATPLSLSIRETPQSVSVVTRQAIEDRKLDNVSDVAKTVTGITTRGLDSSREEFASRGFLIERILLDGVPTAWRSGWAAGESQTSTAIYDHVEVVRGATGLTTGFGNPSAAINLVRKRADSRTLTGDVSVSGGRWDTYGATADVTTPVTESGDVRARIVASHEEGDSFVDLREDKTSVLYGVVDADLTDDTRLSVGASYQDNDPTGSTWGGLPVWFDDGTRTDWDRSKTIGADWTTWASTNQGYFATLEHSLANGWELSARFDRIVQEGDLKLLYISGQLNRDTGEGLGASPRRWDTERVQNNTTLTASGPFQLAGREHELVVGFMNSKTEFESYGFTRSPEPPLEPGNFFEWDGSYPEPAWSQRTLEDERTIRERSFFNAVRLSLTDKTTAILGSRVSDYEIEGMNWAGDFSENRDLITPYGGLIYDLNDNMSTYFSYAAIFNPQEVLDAGGDRVDPIEGDSYEAGVKGEFLEGRLNASLAVFHIIQENTTELGGIDNGQAFYNVQDKVRSDGYEIEVAGQLAPGWEASAGLSSFEARDESGEAANTQFPRRTLKLFTKYNFPGSLSPLTVGGGLNWYSASRKNTDNPVTGQPETLKQGAYRLVSLMAKYDFSRQLSAQVNVSNLLDEEYYSQIGFFNQLAYGEPRNVTATLNYSF